MIRFHVAAVRTQNRGLGPAWRKPILAQAHGTEPGLECSWSEPILVLVAAACAPSMAKDSAWRKRVWPRWQLHMHRVGSKV